tara:strand:- start:5280 stop:6794 length:1515 start_codon:yes stop_codon:yes gene_type:complete
MKKILLSIYLFSITLLSAEAGIIYVDYSATGNNSGTSWTNAFNSLTTALAAPHALKDTFWVAAGTYKPVNANAPFLIEKAERLFGGFSGTETSLSQRDVYNNITILTGDLQGNDNGDPHNGTQANSTYSENAKTIIEIAPATIAAHGAEVIIDGFTITSAHDAVNSSSAINVGNFSLQYLTISNCILENNYANTYSVLQFYSAKNAGKLKFHNNIVRNNYTNSGYAIEYRVVYSGSLHLTSEFVNNIFDGNVVTQSGNDGSCIRFTTVTTGSSITARLVNNTFVNNVEGASGSPINYERTSHTSDILLHLSNNIYYQNVNGIYPALVHGNQGGSGIINSGSRNNLVESQNYQYQSMGGTYQTSVSPFMDFTNGDYRPISAYRTNGLRALYAQTYPTVDVYGNPRISGNAIGLGAVRYMPTTTSLSELNQTETVTLYPNPAQSHLNVRGVELNNSTYQIKDLNGKVCQTGSLDLNGISVANLESGLYFIQINHAGNWINQRFVKQ